MRAGRINRRAVIGHPVIRRRARDNDASVIAEAIERRQGRRTPERESTPPRDQEPGAPKTGATQSPSTDSDPDGRQ